MRQEKKAKITAKQPGRQTGSTKSRIIRDLKQKGFKQAETFPGLFVNENGVIYDLNKQRELKRNAKNCVKYGEKIVNVPKLMLCVFKGETIQGKKQIRYKDDDRNNLSLSNLEYRRIYSTNNRKIKIDTGKLKTAIRCYCLVASDYTVYDMARTRIYLTGIIRKRRFYERHKDAAGLEIFKSYMTGYLNNKVKVSREHKANLKDVAIIVNGFINMLANEIIADLDAGKLEIRPFKPKPKTQAQEYREAIKELRETGLAPIP